MMNTLRVNDLVKIANTDLFWPVEYIPAKWKILAETKDGDGSVIIENIDTGEQNIIELEKLVKYE